MSDSSLLMKAANWLKQSTDRLKSAGVNTAHLDSLIMLEDATGKDRSWLLAHSEYVIREDKLERLNQQIGRRIKHEPLAYIRSKSEFYGRKFIVNNHTLEPRPETETMIELLKQLTDSKQLVCNNETVIADIGTGSGCLAITAKCEWPKFKVVATDIDSQCLKVAKQNARTLEATIEFLKGDLLQPILDYSFKISAVLANLPYVPNSHTINEAAMHEPKHAIFGGPDGLELYRRLFTQITHRQQTPIYILTESLPFQHDDLTKIARSAGYRHQKTDDFIQLFIKRGS